MSEITITEANRDQFGGDYALTSTVPKIHPRMGIPLAGTRASLGDGGSDVGSFLRGDIIFKEDPTKEFNFCLWTDDGTQFSHKFFLLLKRKGFEPAIAADWDLHPDLRGIYQVENTQLVLKGNSLVTTRPSYDVVMVRTAERFLLEEEKERRKQYANIESHSQQKIGEAVTDKRVEVMPTKIEVIQRRYNPDAVESKD